MCSTLQGAEGLSPEVVGREHKHSRLRHAQALAVSEPDASITVAKSIVWGKINNQRPGSASRRGCSMGEKSPDYHERDEKTVGFSQNPG